MSLRYRHPQLIAPAGGVRRKHPQQPARRRDPDRRQRLTLPCRFSSVRRRSTVVADSERRQPRVRPSLQRRGSERKHGMAPVRQPRRPPRSAAIFRSRVRLRDRSRFVHSGGRPASRGYWGRTASTRGLEPHRVLDLSSAVSGAAGDVPPDRSGAMGLWRIVPRPERRVPVLSDGFDERYFLHMEHRDLGRRCRNAELPIRVLPGLVGEHALTTSSVGVSAAFRGALGFASWT